MKIDPMVSPYVWNELYPDPNEGMSKSPLIAGESSSIDGIDYKSG